MKKVLIRKPGNFNRLEVVEDTVPEPQSGEVVVKTASIGVNFADCIVRMGLYPSAEEYVGWPITPGFEFSGIVESVGPDCQRAVGDEVFGVVRFGSYSSHICAPENQLFSLPSGISLTEAGVIPVAALTAYYALIIQGAASKGKRVLVHSAAGGVGTILVQMAQILGCSVVGVVGSAAKAETVRQLGAEHVIVRSEGSGEQQARAAAPDGYDIVLDANGAQSLRTSYKLLRPTGRLVIYGAHSMMTRGSGRPNWFKVIWDFLRTPRFDPLALTNDNKSVMAFNLSYLFEENSLLQRAMTEICDWYASGRLKTTQIQEFPLADVQKAHASLQSGTTIGKLTLVP